MTTPVTRYAQFVETTVTKDGKPAVATNLVVTLQIQKGGGVFATKNPQFKKKKRHKNHSPPILSFSLSPPTDMRERERKGLECKLKNIHRHPGGRLSRTHAKLSFSQKHANPTPSNQFLLASLALFFVSLAVVFSAGKKGGEPCCRKKDCCGGGATKAPHYYHHRHDC